MTLFPMHYARQRHIVFKLFGGDMNAECLESYIFGSFAYTEHTHTLTTDMTFLSQCIQAIMPAIMFCYHSQTSRTTVHGIMLGVVGESHINDNFYKTLNLAVSMTDLGRIEYSE